MGHNVEGFGEVQNSYVRLPSFVEGGQEVMSCRQELCFAREAGPKSVIKFGEDVMLFKVVEDMVGYDMLKELRRYRRYH